MIAGTDHGQDNTAPDAVGIRAALMAVLSSEGFSGARRLRGFLSYVVEESLEGRAAAIRAKTIGMDVYGYSADEIGQRENVVRVDAGRLRRKLEEYYSGPGARDRIIIDLPKGGYAPAFRAAGPVVAGPEVEGPEMDGPVLRGRAGDRGLAVAGLLAVLAIGSAGLLWLLADDRPARNTGAASGPDRVMAEERGAIFDVSPARLEAINIAEAGRDLIFPALDPARLQAALLVFEAATERDPTYFGGHAGIAQVNATRARLVPDPEQGAVFLQNARDASDEALRLAPGEAWSQSARAWTAFAARDFETAQRLSGRAVSLAPSDPHIVEFDALISLYAGDFGRVVTETDRILSLTAANPGFVFQNAQGAALFHMQDYAGAIDAFQSAVENGGPTGPVTVAYLMAANHRLGRQDRAAELASQYADAWPGQRVDLLFQSLFQDPRLGVALSEGMRGAGWRPE